MRQERPKNGATAFYSGSPYQGAYKHMNYNLTVYTATKNVTTDVELCVDEIEELTIALDSGSFSNEEHILIISDETTE